MPRTNANISPAGRPRQSPSGRIRCEFRNLAHAGGNGSTSRILNLARIALESTDSKEYREQPFFRHSQMNKSVIVKHTVRANERDLFDRDRRTVTKLILPFDSRDLKLGGSSVFVGQRGYSDFCSQFFSGSDEAIAADKQLLAHLDDIPSLDPFLVREYVARFGYKPAPCYLKIAPDDVANMVEFANDEISKLVRIAFKNEIVDASVRFASRILSHDLDKELDPLKVSLKLSDHEFSDGIFSWRGFLYFKWRHLQLQQDLITVTKGLTEHRSRGFIDPAQADYMSTTRMRMIDKIFAALTDIGKTLAVYDHAYDALIRREDPTFFRQFLLDGPIMFYELGEGMAVLDHISSFWNYRMSGGRSALHLDPQDFADLLADFDESLSSIVNEDAVWTV
ncbi:hypothetical protein [Asticcacaulis sp. AC402]|uniref:hypothetical protein n=1 Tax=Asticcacaulis sp. AC402 TaxID=1282361 RepID=UPI0003C3DA9E|nr:hypothetical protein [Asticcacaulis sp. AC402]ESQ77592.1 hypothetical protein ABAC402_00250 [Asticcacaulis sp. AC402]